jgi:hypothetical protein
MKELQEIYKYAKDLLNDEPEKSAYWHYNKLIDKIEEAIDVVQCCETLKDCLIAKKPVIYNGKKYYVSKFEIMQNGDEYCDLIGIETDDCVADIKSTSVKIF